MSERYPCAALIVTPGQPIFRTIEGPCPPGGGRTAFALAKLCRVGQTARVNPITDTFAMDHRAVAIIPCSDMDASEAFYRRLGLEVVSDYGDYRILADGRGWHVHLNHVPGWPRKLEDICSVSTFM